MQFAYSGSPWDNSQRLVKLINDAQFIVWKFKFNTASDYTNMKNHNIFTFHSLINKAHQYNAHINGNYPQKQVPSYV